MNFEVMKSVTRRLAVCIYSLEIQKSGIYMLSDGLIPNEQLII